MIDTSLADRIVQRARAERPDLVRPATVVDIAAARHRRAAARYSLTPLGEALCAARADAGRCTVCGGDRFACDCFGGAA